MAVLYAYVLLRALESSIFYYSALCFLRNRSFPGSICKGNCPRFLFLGGGDGGVCLGSYTHQCFETTPTSVLTQEFLIVLDGLCRARIEHGAWHARQAPSSWSLTCIYPEVKNVFMHCSAWRQVRGWATVRVDMKKMVKYSENWGFFNRYNSIYLTDICICNYICILVYNL